MQNRSPALKELMILASMLTFSMPAAAQSPAVPKNVPGDSAAKTPAAKTWRTPWGDPDLQGSWDNSTNTPLERAAKYSDRAFLTAEEKSQADKKEVRASSFGGGGAYDSFWDARGFSDGRTSLIYDPPNGRKPALSAEGQRRQAGWHESIRTDSPTPEHPYNGPEDLDLSTRCIVRDPLPRGAGYGNSYEIVQSPGVVAILQEQIHETRIIRLDKRPHLDQSVRQWLGDTRGHWEGDTLVAETTNYTDRVSFDGVTNTTKNLVLVERWTRVADNRIDYKFTVTDPETWTKPWSAAITWNKGGTVFEYACHEDNVAMYGVLAGARAEEAKPPATKK
jgi:hypothetical protein